MLEKAKSSIMRDINFQNNYIKMLDERINESSLKKLKTMENTENIKKKIQDIKQEKKNYDENNDNFLTIRKEQSEKINVISKEVIFLKNFVTYFV